jgi:hypothetical protein
LACFLQADQSGQGSRDQQLTPKEAKAALLKMMRSRVGQELGWFKGDVPDQMEKIPIAEENEGWYAWTAGFRFNPSRAIYTLVIRPQPDARACVFEYEGVFVLKDKAWSASQPKRIRAALQPGK